MSSTMVSTRGIRYKFSEGERVLCYEPDPTKAKVLYDSKVLEVVESKDKRGRRFVEYLIHFQGWNSSWDRCVSEDFVLKDTEENRQLQRDLAEKSQLQLGAYLYRRERKKGGTSLTGGGGPSKRSRHSFSDGGSSSSTQPDGGETGGETDSSLGSGCSQPPASPPSQGRASITLPPSLRDSLTFDYHLVVKRGRICELPASPSAADILESFVKWFARSGAWRPARSRPANEPPRRPDLLNVCCRLNVVREVADGLRVYFDFILKGHLLYKQEHNQYNQLCTPKEEPVDSAGNKTPNDDKSKEDDIPLANIEANMLSPKIPEYSHLPPDPVDFKPNEIKEVLYPASQKIEVSTSSYKPAMEKPTVEETSSSSKKPLERCTTRAGFVGRRGDKRAGGSPDSKQSPPPASSPHRQEVERLRSHKSGVSHSETEEPAPSTSTGEPRTIENLSSSVGSSESSISSGWLGRRAPSNTPAAEHVARTPLSLLLDKVTKWEIIPRKGTEQLPCRVYGAIHLARLFVKLPDFLNAMQMPDIKLKMILKHIDMFVQYLEEHPEWFGETHYVADATRAR